MQAKRSSPPFRMRKCTLGYLSASVCCVASNLMHSGPFLSVSVPEYSSKSSTSSRNNRENILENIWTFHNSPLRSLRVPESVRPSSAPRRAEAWRTVFLEGRCYLAQASAAEAHGYGPTDHTQPLTSQTFRGKASIAFRAWSSGASPPAHWFLFHSLVSLSTCLRGPVSKPPMVRPRLFLEEFPGT